MLRFVISGRLAAPFFCATALAMALPTHAAAEENPLHAALGAPDALDIHLQIRSRSEAIEGQFRPTAARNDFLQSFRTILTAEYRAGPIRIGGELRDARGYAYAQNSSAGVSEIDAVEPLQAYVALDLANLGGKGATGRLTAGRYTLNLGSGRLVAAPDFPNMITSYTGALFDWKSAAKDRLVAFWGMPSLRFPNDADGLRNERVELDRARSAVQFFGTSYQRTKLGPISAEAYVFRLVEHDSPAQLTRDRKLVTIGGRLFRSPAKGKLDFEIEAAHQTGRSHATTAANDTTDLDVDADTVHAEVGTKFQSSWTPRVVVVFDYASGDDRDAGRYTRFDQLYGAPRSDFGPGGLFGLVNRSNVISGGARVEVAPTSKLDAAVFGRELWLASRTDAFANSGVRDRLGRQGDFAGTQLEARVRYWIQPNRYRIESGTALLFKGDFLNRAANAQPSGDTHYFYLDLSAFF
ncbi:hypothetical protein FHS94_000459 [Sphingomonas aerophila]|uniref:Alginate export domain-containing protein n=2 Tax=Sphingomonas aerophila TaxID=1344948 RepID=A0A7W9BAI3_9SPHN|nr:hypothetical protein [Sphingomonas aerophila]